MFVPPQRFELRPDTLEECCTSVIRKGQIKDDKWLYRVSYLTTSHTIRELLSVYPCDTSLHVCHSTLLIIFCILGEIRTPILWSVAIGSSPLNYEDMLCVWWVSNPRPLEPQSSTLPTELHTPYKPHSVSGVVDFRYRRWKNESLTTTYTLCVS